MHVEVKGGDLPGFKALVKRMEDANRSVLVGVPAGEFEGGAHRRGEKQQVRFNSTRQRIAAAAAKARAEREFRRSSLATEEELRSGPMAAVMRRTAKAAGEAAKQGYTTRTTSGDIPMAMIAAIHEFGKPEIGIPERSFLRGGIQRGRPRFSRLNAANLRCVVLGSKSVDESLEQLGVVAAGEVKREFTAGTFEPNKPATIARKGSSRPLIDTGSLRQSITYVLEGKQSAKARVLR